MNKSTLINPSILFKVINAASDAILIAEKEGSEMIIIYANDAFERLTGYTTDEVLYKDCAFLQGADTDQIASKKVRDANAKNEICNVCIKNYRKDGSMFWNELSITPVYNDEDQTTYFICISKNVTEDLRRKGK